MPKRATPNFEDPGRWKEAWVSYRLYMDRSLEDFRRYSAWFAADMGDLEGAIRKITKRRTRGPLSNLMHLSARVARASQFFRAPRFLAQKVPSFGPSVFTDGLAEVETLLLNDFVDETDLFREGRRTIMDGILGGEMIFKVGYSSDVGIDHEQVQRERALAQAEGFGILMYGARPQVKSTDYDRGHIEEHEQSIAAVERGDVQTDSKSLAYLKKHLKKHEDRCRKHGDRPLETVRFESAFAERICPTRFGRDPSATRDAERKWVTMAFLRPVDDVREDPEYDSGARAKVEAKDPGEDFEARTGEGRIEPETDYALLHETVDLVRGKVLVYDPDGEKPLRVRPYTDQRIFPGGPFVTAAFCEDPITDTPFSMMRAIEGHQQNLALADEVFAATLRRIVPVKVFKKGTFDADTLKKLQNNRIPDAWVSASDLDPGVDINKVIQQLDPAVIPDFAFGLRALHERGIERQMGGSARLGGGDTSKTATASAIVQESGSDTSEDMQSVLDDFLSRVGRAALRVMRRYYPQSKVAEIAGEKALESWPRVWSERDIVRDRGVSVVAGSSRRKNIAVEQKLLVELFVAVQTNPNIPPQASVELFKRVLHASGVNGINLDGMEQMLQMQETKNMLDMADGGGEAVPQPRQGPGRNPKRRASARGEGTPSAQRQGLANAGGGRVPTGAGQGDAQRPFRS